MLRLLLLFSLLISSASAQTWQADQPLNTERANFALVSVGSSLLAIGGTSDPSGSTALANLEILDTSTPLAQWSVRNFPPQVTPVYGAACTVLDGFVFRFGGIVGSGFALTDEVWRYDPSTDNWTAMTSMPTPRCLQGVFQANGLIYLIGGREPGWTFKTDVWIYDPSKEDGNPSLSPWSNGAPMPEACEPFVLGYKGDAYLLGRYTGANEVEKEIWRYRASDDHGNTTSAWWTVGQIPSNDFGYAWVRHQDNVFLVGGRTDSAGHAARVDTVHALNLNNLQWTMGPVYPLAVDGMQLASVGGILYGAGGMLTGSDFTANVYRLQ
ncbi:MAG: hypothetical protein DWQ01_05085 [Planctomycetota bacterium]|nr:MAG: hypothetical protein DWQ01_05085 [Planctomycetota bacterium]